MSDRTEEQAAADQRWVRDQHFVLNVTFATLMGLLFLGCCGGVALWVLIPRSDQPVPPAGPVDTQGLKK